MKDQQKDGALEQAEMFKRRRSEIPDAERLQTLQTNLYQKAKEEKGFKFYVLYDKLLIPYVLREAWISVKRQDSGAGIDGLRVSDIEKSGVAEFIEQIKEDLRKQTYKPQPIKRMYARKPNGKERPIGISCIRDRVVQTACKLIIEPIYEADFEECSHGFRPGRSSAGAIREIRDHLQSGKTEVYDADLTAYFDTIPHNKLYAVLRERIADKRILKLIDKFLKVPVQEGNNLKGGKNNKTGVPQGGVISPLLANIYMNLVDRNVNCKQSIFDKTGTRIVRYADDFVLMTAKLTSSTMEKLHSLLARMGLSLNTEKSKQIHARTEMFDFLGFSFRYDQDLKGRDKQYLNIFPSKKSLNKVREKLRSTLHSKLHYSKPAIVSELNRILSGWLNYFEIENVSYTAKAKRDLRKYLGEALYRYYNRKSQRKSSLSGQQAFEVLVKHYHLIDPSKYKLQRQPHKPRRSF